MLKKPTSFKILNFIIFITKLKSQKFITKTNTKYKQINFNNISKKISLSNEIL